jgi:hypothetical protein
MSTYGTSETTGEHKWATTSRRITGNRRKAKQKKLKQAEGPAQTSRVHKRLQHIKKRSRKERMRGTHNILAQPRKSQCTRNVKTEPERGFGQLVH